MNNLSCPQCGLSHSKKNGHTSYGNKTIAASVADDNSFLTRSGLTKQHGR